MTWPTPFSIADAKKLMEQMLQDAGTNADVPTKEVVLRGTFAAFTDSFFVDDAPITDSTRASIRLRIVLRNAHQELSVVLWGRAATAILNMSSDELLAVWETGNEDASKQEELLTSLNRRLAQEYDLACSLKVWKSLTSNVVQVNANDAQYTVADGIHSAAASTS